MARLTPHIAGALALILVLTSGAMAVARGQTMAAGSIVICAGGGPVSIPVDADGNPTGPAHICPDCALSLLDAAAPADPDVACDARLTTARYIEIHDAAPSASTPAARARAPPPV